MPIPGYPELKSGLPARGKLLRLWQKQRPDIVHIATEGPLGWSACSAARKLGIPVSTDCPTFYGKTAFHFWFRLVRLKLFKRASIICPIASDNIFCFQPQGC